MDKKIQNNKNHHNDHKNHHQYLGCDDKVCSCEKGIFKNIEEFEEKKSKKPLIILGIGIIIFIFGYFISTIEFNIFENLINSGLLSQIIYLVVVIVVGQGIIKEGIESLINKKIRIEFLVTIATIGAFLLGDGAEGVSLIILFFFAEYLEEYSLDKSKRSIANLINLNPKKAMIKKDGEEIELDVTDVDIGNIVVVKPGDKIPVDGIISYGRTSVDQSSITGESFGVSKKEEDEVYASTINEEGYIEIKVTKKCEDTIFSKIVDLIKESEEKKAKVDLFIDKFAKYYTPIIMTLAFFVAIIPYLLFGESLVEWTYRSLVLLVIACPCALVISTPVSMVSAITAGFKKGIIIKGAQYIESLSKTKAVLFDKTGTLTEGNLEINDIIPFNGFSKEKIISIACSLEEKSKHPIAKTFKEYKNNHNISLKKVHEFESIAGKGLKGKINGKTYYIGKKELFDYNESFYKDIDKFNKKENLGKTNIIIGNNNSILGFISLTDKIRENGFETIEKLKKQSIKTVMLTGDNHDSAKMVFEKLGLDNYYPNLLPEDKVKRVENILNEYQEVAMVGDGVNDTPSLARANVGIAMGMNGADVAVETGDIVLMQDDISLISFLISLAKKTMVIVKQNIVVTLSVKGLLAILGIIGYLTLWEAVLIGDMGLTLLVVANSLRIEVKS
ncbi:MAG: heavy metal translocating P-type ATPase [Methanobacteriaceae archaeon]|nr:heavy metal translocating P-type ATPase [Candidatus Methanorudis spinitermitis]